jgi:hypothetical protein
MTTQTTAQDAVGFGRGGRMSRQRKRDAVLRLLRGGEPPDHHRPGREGLAVRCHRALERRSARLARCQTRRSLRCHRGRQHGGAQCVRSCQPERRPRLGAATRPWQRVPGRTFPQPDPLLGHDPELCVRGRARNEWRHRTVLPHAEESKSCTAASTRPSTRSVTPSATSLPATMPTG